MTSRWRSTNRGAGGGGDGEDPHGRGVRPRGHGREGGCLGGVALRLDRAGAGRRALGEGRGEVEGPVRAARDLHRLTASVGNEGAESVVVSQRAARLTEQVRDRVPAAGDQEQVDGEPTLSGGLPVRGDRHGGEAVPAFRAGDRVSGQHLDPGGPGTLGPFPRIGPGVDDRRDVQSRRRQVECGGVGAVVGREHDRVTAGQNGVPVEVGPGRGRQHHARAVVVAECERALVGAGREDHAPGADPPDALAGDVVRGRGAEVVGPALDGEDVVVVVVAEDGGAAQDAHLGVGFEPRARRLHPVEVFAGAEQAAAGFRLVVGEDDACAAVRRGRRGREAGRARADDQQLAVGVHGVVAGGVGFGGEAALAGEAARDQTAVELDGRGGEHGLGEGGLDLDDRVGFFDAGREDAAGAPEPDARRCRDDPCREERRGEGVPSVALVFGTVEDEGEGGVPIDSAAGGEAVGLVLVPHRAGSRRVRCAVAAAWRRLARGSRPLALGSLFGLALEGRPGCGGRMWLGKGRRGRMGRPRLRSRRTRLPRLVDGEDLVRRRVPHRVEPPAAAGRVAPPLGERSFGVVAEEEVPSPLLVGEGRGVLGIGHVCLAAVVELGLVAGPAPRAGDEQHGSAP